MRSDLLRTTVDVIFAAKRTMTTAEIAAEIRGYDALIVGNDPVDDTVFAAADRLRLVHMHGTGLDAIDVAAATERGILVANAPGVNRNAVAELTVALMLIAARSIDRHIEILKAGRWDRSAGVEVSGKTIGVLGLGNTGRRRRRTPLRLRCSRGRFRHPAGRRLGGEPRRRAGEIGRRSFRRRRLPGPGAVAQRRRPRGSSTPDRLALMKPSAILINTARGGLIDEAALCAALAEKRIAGAALDAFDPEPLAADSPLRSSGAVLTPHLAATSREAAANVSRAVAKNVVDVLLFGRVDCAVNAAEDRATARRSRAVISVEVPTPKP